MATIAAAFWPKPVIVRLSDFKSNEYRKLIGGSRYEPEEENPMLGFRGAARYLSKDFGEAFAMECEALRRVRNEMGLVNVQVMVPFVRTLGEADKVTRLLAEQGLKRGQNELKVIMINHGGEPFPIRRGERIAQLVPAAVTLAEWDEVEELCETARGAGGFGSTGGHGSL